MVSAVRANKYKVRDSNRRVNKTTVLIVQIDQTHKPECNRLYFGLSVNWIKCFMSSVLSELIQGNKRYLHIKQKKKYSKNLITCKMFYIVTLTS